MTNPAPRQPSAGDRYLNNFSGLSETGWICRIPSEGRVWLKPDNGEPLFEWSAADLRWDPQKGLWLVVNY